MQVPDKCDERANDERIQKSSCKSRREQMEHKYVAWDWKIEMYKKREMNN